MGMKKESKNKRKDAFDAEKQARAATTCGFI
jgi:hypothetical protein